MAVGHSSFFSMSVGIRNILQYLSRCFAVYRAHDNCRLRRKKADKYRLASAKALPGIKLHSESPGPLTEEMFWFKDGEFTPLPYNLVKGRIHFVPPEEFVGLLNSLAESHLHNL